MTVSPSPEQLSELVDRLLKRAEIRRQIPGRKSVLEGAPDRISDLLEEAADALQSARAEIARLTTALQKIAECAEEEASDRVRQTKLFAIAAKARAALKDSPNVG